MKINQYTKQDLTSIPDSDRFWEQNNISGIREKIVHLLKNPALCDKDYVLFTGEESDQVVSYLTVCPEIIKLNGDISKIYWLNSWWVDPAFQDTGIAGFIFFKAWNILDKKIAVSSFSGSAEQFYERIGKFDVLKDKTRFSIFLNIDTSLILLKFNFLKSFTFLLKLMRIPLLLCYFCLTLAINRLLKKNNIEIKSAADFDDQIWDYVNRKTNSDLVIKSKEYFKWKLDNLISYQVLHAGTIVGFLSFSQIINNQKSLNNKVLRVEYFLSDSKYNKMIIFLIISLAYKFKCNRIVTESEELSHELHKYRFFWLFKITQKKNAIISKTFKINMNSAPEISLHLGDGG